MTDRVDLTELETDPRVVQVAILISEATLTPHWGWHRWVRHAQKVVDHLTCDTAIDAAWRSGGDPRNDVKRGIDAAILHEVQPPTRRT